MKQITILCLFLCTIGGLYAIEGGFIGLGPEINGNTREGAAIGGGLTFGIDLNSRFALGLKTSFSHNLNTVGTLEPLAFFRYKLPLGGLFLQAETGAAVYFEHGEAYPAFSGGLAAGWRFNLGKNWYLEPALRGGYPFIWGLGITAGYRFGIKAAKAEKPVSGEVEFSRTHGNITIEETPGGKIVRLLNAVYFQADSSLIIEKYRPILDGAGERLRSNPNESIILRGYTAPFGTAEGRAEISSARARFCAEYLLENYGIASSRMKIENYGAEKLPEFRDAGWESYRCVELIIE